MAKRRGSYRTYHYRGKANMAKIALAAFLVLVILLAVGVIWMQQNVVYDETGMPRIELPWENGGEAEETERPALDLVIENAPSAQTKPTVKVPHAQMPEGAVSAEDPGEE